MKRVERRPGIWPAERELLEEEERERKERALGRIRPWEVDDEAMTALTSGMADAWPRHSLVGGDARRVAEPSYRSHRPVMPVGPVWTWVLQYPPSNI